MATESSSASLSPARRWIFRLTASVLLPLVVLGAVEIAFRLAGVGHSTSFFVPRQLNGEKVLVENPAFGLSFFPPALARSASPVVMRAEKPPGTFRIFLFGESAALGDPRPAYGAGRYLESLLRERFPGTQSEVICVAVTAIDSHAILPIARECARYQGDLWIVYMGNNEFVGPFGACAVSGPKAPPAWVVRGYLGLQQTRVGQTLGAWARRLGSRKTPATWGGMKMFLDQQLAPADPVRERVYRNFQANLEAIVRAGTDAGVPIILSSVASNLKDCPPFGSVPPQGLTPEKLAAWNALLQSGGTNQALAQFRQALEYYEQAAQMAPEHPELQFRRGECFLAMTNVEAARRCFVQARDLDALPFRADSRINRIIAETAASYARRRVLFLDAEQALAAASPTGLAGEELFYEHVHLTFGGNHRLALAMAEQSARCLPAERVVGQRPDWADEAICNRRLALTDWNRRSVFEEIKSRLMEAPFSSQLGHAERLKRVDQRIGEIQMHLRTQSRPDASTVYQDALKLRPQDHWLHHNYAEFLTGVGDLPQATSEMQAVCKLIPQNYSAYFHLGRLQARQKKFEEACHSLETALTLQPEFTDIYLELGRTCANRADWPGALKYCDLARERHLDDGRVPVLKAKILESLDRRQEAVVCLREAIQLQASLWEAHDMLGAEMALDGRFAEAQAEFEEVVRLRPDYADGHLNLGIALARQQRFAEARAELQNALRLEPQNRRAQEFLATLTQLQK